LKYINISATLRLEAQTVKILPVLRLAANFRKQCWLDKNLKPLTYKRILLTNPWFERTLGLLVFAGYILWLALPTRIPAITLFGLALAGVAAAIYAKQPARAREWAKILLKPKNLLLGLILIVAVGVRLPGISQSLPYLDNPDEPTTVTAAIKMLQTGDLNPHFFRWPSLPFYTQFILSLPQFLSGVGSGAFTGLNQIVPDNFYLAGRLLSATLGIATVGLIYLIGRIVYSSAAGLTAAFILAIIPLHSENSRYVTPDIMVGFFATLTLLFAALIYKTGQLKWYLWAGVASGLTIGTKYNVAIVLITVVLAHFLSEKRKGIGFVRLGATIGLALGVFILTTPFLALDLSGFLNEMAFQVRHYTLEGHGANFTGESWKAYLSYIFNEAFVYQGVVALGGGILLALIRQSRADWLILSLPATGYFFFSSALVHFPRNLIPLLPSMALLAAEFILWLTVQGFKLFQGKMRDSNSRLVIKTFIVVILTLGFFFFGIRNSILTTRYNLQPDTRIQAGAWITQNLPVGAKLRLEPFTPYLSPERFQGVTEQRPIGGRGLEWYQQQGYDYLVASSYEYKELIATDPQAALNYSAIFQEAQLVKEFPGDSAERPGPTIRIYKVR